MKRKYFLFILIRGLSIENNMMIKKGRVNDQLDTKT